MKKVIFLVELLLALAVVVQTGSAEQNERNEAKGPGTQLAAECAGDADAHAAHPVPLINQPLVPDVATPGGDAFTLTLDGTGFNTGATIRWNGRPRPTKFVSGDRLTATINAADIAIASTASVTVVNPGCGRTASNVTFFPVTNPTPSVFFAGSSLTAGTEPIQVAVGDFNGDGKLDMVIVNFNCTFSPIFQCNGPGSVSIFLGNGDGTFHARTDFGVGVGPVSVVVGDFNGDGKLDLATANLVGNTVSVLLGNGDGTFQPNVEYPTGTGPSFVAVGDFNRDGKIDVAVANVTSNTISILLGNGDGTFQTNVDYATGTGPQGVGIGDFNGDGKLDLAVNDLNCPNFPVCGPGMVSILLGNGDGTFRTHVEYPTGPTPDSLAVGDFNGDGHLDLVTANGNFGTNNTVSVLLGNGDGTFQPNVDYATGTAPSFVALGDLNGDGKIDMAVANAVSNTVSVLLGNGDGTFQPNIDFPGGPGANGIAAGDFNGDGRLDLVIADFSPANTIFVLLQPPTVP
jgi:hypothetical protein